MKFNNKKIIILITIILVYAIIFVVAIYFEDQFDSNTNNNTPSLETPEIINKRISLLTEEKEYFKIQNAINTYYEMLIGKDNNSLYKILEEEYVIENNITPNNVTNIINSNYEVVSFIAKEIYYNANSTVTYYFINGYVFNQTVMEDYYSYEGSVNYLLIEKNGKYVIKPLTTDININNYAKNYEIKDININNNFFVSEVLITEKTKLVTYITEFKNLLILDSLRAYDMLDDETKSKYINYEEFYNQRYDIYNKLATNIYGIAKEENNNSVEYNIKDINQATIKITEHRVMDYKIGY